MNKFVNLKEEDFVSEKHTSPDVLWGEKTRRILAEKYDKQGKFYKGSE